MSWAFTAVSVGSSLIASSEANKQAKSNAAATGASLLQNFKVTKNSIIQQANELNNQIGMELTQAQLEGLKAEATTSNVVVERNVVGNTAARLQDNIDMQSNLYSNQIKQKAEANMVDIQNKLTESKYQYEAGMMQNAIQLSNATTSTTGMITGAVSAGMQGYSMGSKLGGTSKSGGSPLEAVGVDKAGASNYGSLASWENDVFE